MQPADPDHRRYVIETDMSSVHIQQSSDKVYCFSKTPGDDGFHRLTRGEVYLLRDGEKLCLNCAIRLGFVSVDRMFWQRREKW